MSALEPLTPSKKKGSYGYKALLYERPLRERRKKRKKRFRPGENIYECHLQQRLAARIYKELSKLNNKETSNPIFKMYQRLEHICHQREYTDNIQLLNSLAVS